MARNTVLLTPTLRRFRFLIGALAFVLVGSSVALIAPVANAQSVGARGDNLIVEEVIPKNDADWWYNDSLVDLGTTWRGINYTYGTGWKNAQARFSNDACCNTRLNVSPYENAVYFRKEFTVDNLAQVTEMAVSFQYDDAAILWLNGKEVYRTIRGNLPAAGEVPYDYDVMTGGAEDLYVEMPGDNYVEQHPTLGRDLTVWVPAIAPANLSEGKNVFAVMLFNRRGSKDTSTDLALRLTRDVTPTATATPLPTATPLSTATPLPTAPPQPTAVVQPTETPDLGDPPDRLGFSTVSATAGCLPRSGRVDVSITNTADVAKTYTVNVGAISRTTNAPAAQTETVTVTGRPDGPYLVSVDEAGSTIFQENLTVDCSPNIEVTVQNSCLASNGRIDVYLKNTTSTLGTYSVTVGNLAPRKRTLASVQSKRVTVTGRPDGELPVVVQRNGVTIASEIVTVDCDPNIPALVKTSCLSGNGRIDTYLTNMTPTNNRYAVTVSDLVPRDKTVRAGDSHRVAVTGRRDGNYTVTATENGVTILNETVTISCDR